MTPVASKTRRTTGVGSGKLILFGEHAVVYGCPAIVAGLGSGATAAVSFSKAQGLRLTDGITGEPLVEVHRGDDDLLARAYDAMREELDVAAPMFVNVVMHLPVGSGLGSSAAFAVAVCRAIQTITNVDDDTVARAVAASERVFHGRPSGIDQAAALRGGVFWYRREKPPRPLDVPETRVVVCQASAGASTSAMVQAVRALDERQPEPSEKIRDAISAVVDAAEPALLEGDWRRVGELMNINHGLLASLGVSTPELDAACHVARAHGAHGAKLTGAGGGGCVVAIAPDDRHDEILDAWGEQDWQTFTFDLAVDA